MGRGGKRRADRQKAKGRKPIDPLSAYAGALGARRNARRLFNDALLLHNGGRFRGAIPLSILSVEESLKGIELGISFRKLRDIPASEQERLTSHEHKLRHVHGWVVGNMEDGRMRDVYAGLVREGKVPLEGGRPISLEAVAENARHTRELVRDLQHVKELCVYEGWDEAGGSWAGLDLGDGDAEALSAFILALAMMHYDNLHMSTEFALDTVVARNPVFEKLREEKAELDSPAFDLGTAQRGEDVLQVIRGRAGARNGDAGRRAGG